MRDSCEIFCFACFVLHTSIIVPAHHKVKLRLGPKHLPWDSHGEQEKAPESSGLARVCEELGVTDERCGSEDRLFCNWCFLGVLMEGYFPWNEI